MQLFLLRVKSLAEKLSLSSCFLTISKSLHLCSVTFSCVPRREVSNTFLALHSRWRRPTRCRQLETKLQRGGRENVTEIDRRRSCAMGTLRFERKQNDDVASRLLRSEGMTTDSEHPTRKRDGWKLLNGALAGRIARNECSYRYLVRRPFNETFCIVRGRLTLGEEDDQPDGRSDVELSF